MSDEDPAGGLPPPPPPPLQQDSAEDRVLTEDVISSCKTFKNQLMEFIQKERIPSPVYETTKEGPSHKPIFHSTVIVNEVRYSSLLGFGSRKAAEQSAAQTALLELAKSGQGDCSISQPGHDTGLCKTLIQEYAQKMSLGNPLYEHQKHPGNVFQCSVVIGSRRYLGEVAPSKKEAEKKAARVAWLAIKEGPAEVSNRSAEKSLVTVSLSRKRVLEAPSVPNETTNTSPQAKKARSKKKHHGKKKKKPESQLPESGPSEHTSNDCHFEDGDPGAALERMNVSISTLGPQPPSSSQLDSAGDRARTQDGILSCKNFKSQLQEYAQKMSLADPLYQLEDHRRHGYQYSVVIGWRRYLGEVATSKEEAEIKAARTAWHAIKKGHTVVPDRSTETSLPAASLSRKKDEDCSLITAQSKVRVVQAKDTSKERNSGIRKMLAKLKEGVEKDANCSWITAQGKVHAFDCKDTSHERNSDIQKMLAKLKEDVEAAGYVSDTSPAPDVSEDTEERSAEAWQHSEKIALAFGLISIPPGLPISILNNLSICGDCHNTFKNVRRTTFRPAPGVVVAAGVSSCYIFKSRLQEYAQKAGFPTPVYETTKEGLPHEPFFKSTVIVNEVRYDSLLGFMNRKAAEQSAAEVALLELTKSGQVNCRISQPVHETGLCKNLLQEYALKMGYANPLYQHEKLETQKHRCGYQCSVMIGGTKYIGAVATSKKEAEIKAARIAWFAIKESSIELSERSTENAMLTVIPSRKRVLEAPSVPMETTNTASKAKKARFNKKMPVKKRYGKKKPTSQVPESGPSRPISNACYSVDGQPGAQFQHMAVGEQAQCQYPRGMEGALGESINNSNPTLDNQNLMLQQMGGHGANIQEGNISGKPSNTGWLNLCCGNTGEDSKGDPSVATGVPGDSAPSAVGSSTPSALVGDKGCQTANVNHTCAQDSTGVFENSMGDTTMANVEVTEDGKMSVVGTRANDVGSHGANIHNTNGEDSTEILQESKRDATMASGVTEDAELSAVETQAADVGGEDSTDILQESKGDTTMASEEAKLSTVGSQAADVGRQHGTNIHTSSCLHSTGAILDSKWDTSMANGTTEYIVLSAAETQAPVGSQEGSHGTNIHHTIGLDSTGMIEASDGDTSMASGCESANFHDSNGCESARVIELSKEDTTIASGATEVASLLSVHKIRQNSSLSRQTNRPGDGSESEGKIRLKNSYSATVQPPVPAINEHTFLFYLNSYKP
ncbi:unnamed protein product [Linum tenue]|uniref:DRBM domain-containing protein n=1 Tax=Linum tenue TaxID=586396 RepID=A0AAV0N1R8_9ROSI|nr:unnamed protein product [Linum tenue]